MTCDDIFLQLKHHYSIIQKPGREILTVISGIIIVRQILPEITMNIAPGGFHLRKREELITLKIFHFQL